MRSSRFRVGPKYNDQCPYKRKGREIRDAERQRESSVKTELETGLMNLQAKERTPWIASNHQELREKRGRDTPPRLRKKTALPIP